jgi:hypothetical protein
MSEFDSLTYVACSAPQVVGSWLMMCIHHRSLGVREAARHFLRSSCMRMFYGVFLHVDEMR